ADRGQPGRVDLRQGSKRVERGAAATANALRFAAKAADERCHLLQIARLPALAKHVSGQRDVTVLGEPTRAAHREFFQSYTFMKDDDAWPRRGGVFVTNKIAAQIGCAVAVVDVGELHQSRPVLASAA